MMNENVSVVSILRGIANDLNTIKVSGTEDLGKLFTSITTLYKLADAFEKRQKETPAEATQEARSNDN